MTLIVLLIYQQILKSTPGLKLPLVKRLKEAYKTSENIITLSIFLMRKKELAGVNGIAHQVHLQIF